MGAYLAPVEPSCRNPVCATLNVGVISHPEAYHIHGRTPAGSVCYFCPLCKDTFSVKSGKPAKNHHLPYKNSEIFRLLVNTVSMRRICRIAEIRGKTLYDKIRFIHRQCMAFVARRERRLLTGEVVPDRLYLSVDRQDHLIN